MLMDNEYEFPTDRIISTAVQQPIQQILSTPTPSLRSTLHEIVDHLFFTQRPVPSYILFLQDQPLASRFLVISSSGNVIVRIPSNIPTRNDDFVV